MNNISNLKQLRQLNSLLNEALALPAQARDAWLQTLAPDAAHLRPTLSNMLHSTPSDMLSRSARDAVETQSFLDSPVSLPRLHDLNAMKEEVQDAAGDNIGAYQLIKLLGVGGMGTVWLAERADGVFKRQVALKLPRYAWVPGLVERMRRERHILAALEHPHIAHLHDAGVTADTHRPYLALEYVQGRAIDQYCEEHALSIEARLRLFLQVMQAVSHAHARLVVHRDLKPTNMWVTEAGEMKLLDFGVAKLLHGDGEHLEGEATQLTHMMGRAYTPDYASPEQITGGTITVASDVYSLGVVLYELLCGQRPYQLGSLSHAALEQQILHQAIPLASSKAKAHAASQLKGDLDTILGKALQADADKRYRSVDAFAEDVQRYLAHEPVLAQPDSLLYRARKFVARHTLGVISSVAILAALTTGGGMALTQWREAKAQKELALESLQQTEAALEFANSVLTEGMQLDERITLQELLQRAQAMTQTNRYGDAYTKLNAVDMVVAWYISYGAGDRAVSMIDKALADFQADPAMDQAKLQGLVCKRAAAYSGLGKANLAIQDLDKALNTPGIGESTRSYCLQRRALAARDVGDAANALRYVLQAKQSLDKTGLQSPSRQALLLCEIAYAYSLNGQAKLADDFYQQAMKQYTAIGREEEHTTVAVRNNWGIADLSSGAPKAALEKFEAAKAIAAKHSSTGAAPDYLLHNTVDALLELARYEPAAALIQQLQAKAERTNNHQHQALGVIFKATLHTRLGEYAQAQQLLDTAAALIQQHQLPDGSAAARRLRAVQTELWLATGRYADAQTMATQQITRFDQQGAKHNRLVLALAARAEASLALKQSAEAASDARRALSLAKEVQGAAVHSSVTGRALFVTAKVYAAQGQPKLAQEHMTLAHAHFVQSLGADHPQASQAKL
jgi:eukaryotic-like serine/threonine-protein kinase